MNESLVVPEAKAVKKTISEVRESMEVLQEMQDLETDFPELFRDGSNNGNWFSRHKRDIGMVGAGLGAGLAAAVGVWFYDRRKRKQMLEQITFAIKAAKTVLDVPDARSVLAMSGKDVEIKAADFLIENNADLQRVIETQMTKFALGQKEHTDWVHALRALSQLAQVVQAKFHKIGGNSSES